MKAFFEGRRKIVLILVAAAVVLAGVAAGGYIYVRDNVGLRGDQKAAAEYDALDAAVRADEAETAEEKEEEDKEVLGALITEDTEGVVDVVEDETPAWASPDFEPPSLNIDWAELESINDDLIGWLYAPQLGISYPAVQAYYDGQYEHTTFSGEDSHAGAIFMDSISRNDFKGYSDFLFGHNMRDGSMFGGLKKLEASGGASIVNKSPYIYVYTPENIMQYRIFAWYRTLMGSPTYDDIQTEEDYDKFVKMITGQSDYPLPADVSFEDYPEILTLSTCNGMPGGNKRLVVHTVKCGVREW